MNASELISQILRRLDELDPENPIHRTRAEILVFVNDTITELNLIAWEFQSTAALSIDATHNVYDTPTPILAPISIRDGEYLRSTSAHDLDLEVKWDVSSRAKTTVKSWASIGLNKILIDPKPLASKSIYVEGIIEHTAVTDAAVALPVNPEYESMIEDYCVERGKFKDGGWELFQAGRLYDAFLSNAQDAAKANVIRMYPKYSYAVIDRENIREAGQS